jgi:hypothetical protein
MTGQRASMPEREWWRIPDFDPAVGDIKAIWELSRMDWVLAFAQHARNGDAEALASLNRWLADWCSHNRPYCGPNWKCGQEASIRVVHMAVASLILGQVRNPEPALRDLVYVHLQRIAPTLQYAMAQDNNHGSSEAAALFIGGSWLALLGMPEGERWRKAGQHWLENRAARLIGNDGSFSQYSLNYHRLMLDTFCVAEVWRLHLALQPFSARWHQRMVAATKWLHHLVNSFNGDGPNVGANDGARLLQLSDTAYRDFRPTVQLAMALFTNQRAYAEEGKWNDAFLWLGVPMPQVLAPSPCTFVADGGGFAMLRHRSALVMLRYPRFRFRPSQADALHLDLWQAGDNLLRDGGSYSYNTGAKWQNYFSGTACHNTVQFDDRDQMPRLGRFLFGDWLKTSYIEALKASAREICFGAGYRDRWHASHRRRVTLTEGRLHVADEVAGFAEKAILRWRLAPGSWQLQGQKVNNGAHVLTVHADIPIVRCELVEGWESRHYLEKTLVPVLEIEIRQTGTITTEYRWAV